MNKELENPKIDPTSKSEASEDPHSKGDFRKDEPDNISDTYLEHKDFIDVGTAVACMEGGLIYPASPKTIK